MFHQHHIFHEKFTFLVQKIHSFLRNMFKNDPIYHIPHGGTINQALDLKKKIMFKIPFKKKKQFGTHTTHTYLK